MNILLNKEHPDLPDYYKIDVHYFTGPVETFEIVSHAILKEIKTIEIITKDDCFILIPLSTIKKICFDKNWNKIVEIRNEIKRNKDGKSS